MISQRKIIKEAVFMNDMTTEQLVEHIDAVSASYKGNADVLIGAIGALMIGRVYGWRVLRIVIGSSSYTKYQRVLGLEFKVMLKPTTALSDKSLGFKLVLKLNNFWDVVKGVASIDPKEKRMLV
jgi:hypothetical protein